MSNLFIRIRSNFLDLELVNFLKLIHSIFALEL